MKAQDLAALFADEVAVEHGGHTYTLRAPTMPEAMAITQRFGEAAAKLPEGADGRAPYLAAVAEAVELTLAVEDGELPEGIGQRIVLGTGGIQSPIGEAAAKLVGLPVLSGAREVPDNLPT